MTFNTIEEIAHNVIARFSVDDREWFKKMTQDDMRYGPHHLGRWIRNTYGLWHDHPLTEKWRTDLSSHVMIDGVDHSEDHPDNLSGRIIDRVRVLLHGGR